MSPHANVRMALLLVTVCMVRAYPQSQNQTATGFGESGWYRQHNDHGVRNSRSNRNSGPTIDHSPASVQNFARNQHREFPGQEFIETPVGGISRQHSTDNRRTLQQPQRHVYHSEPVKHARQTSPRPAHSNQNNQQNARRAQYRSIQSRTGDVPLSNEDQNRIEKKPHANLVNTNHHQVSAPVSRAYQSPPTTNGRVPETRRFSEALKMAPQPSVSSHPSRPRASMPVQRNNATLATEEFGRDSFNKSRIPPRALSSSGSEGGIVFPDQKLPVPRIGEGGPECAKGLTFCEDIEGYPSKHISLLIQKESNLYQALFGTDVLVPEIANRISPDEELCKYNEHVAYPKVGQTKDEKWAWIANTDDFKQGVRVEVCQNPGSECQLPTNWPMGYKTECKQKHIYRRLLSVANDGTPSTDEFLFPSCCVCTVIKTI